jgi:hypothetical protein
MRVCARYRMGSAVHGNAYRLPSSSSMGGCAPLTPHLPKKDSHRSAYTSMLPATKYSTGANAVHLHRCCGDGRCTGAHTTSEGQRVEGGGKGALTFHRQSGSLRTQLQCHCNSSLLSATHRAGRRANHAAREGHVSGRVESLAGDGAIASRERTVGIPRTGRPMMSHGRRRVRTWAGWGAA